MTELQPECINLYKPDGTETSLQNRIYKSNTVSPAICTGYRPFYLVGGGYKMSKEVTVFEHRVDEPFRTFNGGVCGTLRTTEACGDKHVLIKPELDDYRIRKLTPRECWRLMGFSDKDFSNAEKVNSNTQLYKQAGNSIVVNVLEGLFSSLL